MATGFTQAFSRIGHNWLTTTTTTTISPITCVKYGLLYNWYTVIDSRKITSSDDWIVPTRNDYVVLKNYLDPLSTENPLENIAGGKLKQTGTTYWNSPNTGATNEVGFNGRGTGFRRDIDGSFLKFKEATIYWTPEEEYDPEYAGTASLQYDVSYFYVGDGEYGTMSQKKRGASIRLLYTGSGTPTTYMGNDGKIYPVVIINAQRWLAYDLAETKYRNNDSIAEVINNTEWISLTTGALCAYNNDWSNVLCGNITTTTTTSITTTTTTLLSLADLTIGVNTINSGTLSFNNIFNTYDINWYDVPFTIDWCL